MVYTPIGDMLDRVAAKHQKPVPVHICVDTGIGRVGVPYREAPPLIRDLASRPSVAVLGTMMTFTEDPELDKEQLRRFNALCHTLEAEGIRLGSKHASSSYALFQNPDSFLDMVRPGMAIFGVYSEQDFRSAGVMELRPVHGLKAKVIFVKKLRTGDSAGYNRAYVAENDVWVATLPVGHTDGLPRVAAKGARVRIGGRSYPLIATVSASHSIAEIGPDPQVAIGDVVTVFDWKEGSRPEDVSASCKSSVYDLTMHLNPLLPRRVIQEKGLTAVPRFV
jgi:alanine racemase